jgi:hypothetical protein
VKASKEASIRYPKQPQEADLMRMRALFDRFDVDKRRIMSCRCDEEGGGDANADDLWSLRHERASSKSILLPPDRADDLETKQRATSTAAIANAILTPSSPRENLKTHAGIALADRRSVVTPPSSSSTSSTTTTSGTPTIGVISGASRSSRNGCLLLTFKSFLFHGGRNFLMRKWQQALEPSQHARYHCRDQNRLYVFYSWLTLMTLNWNRPREIVELDTRMAAWSLRLIWKFTELTKISPSSLCTGHCT